MKVNEIFYSIQGEGRNAGTPAVFVRFSGCNLKCPFCDTDFSSYTEMSEEEILDEINKYGCDFVVLTGGEPTLQVTPKLLELLRKSGKYIAIETNGTRQIDAKLYDWVTVSPKYRFVSAKTQLNRLINEVKLVANLQTTQEWLSEAENNLHANYYYLQPCDTGETEKNKEIIEHVITLVKENPTWKISIQLHKMLGVR